MRMRFSLEERLSRYIPKAHRVTFLEEQVFALQKECHEMATKIKELCSKCGKAEAHNHAIAFERDEALQKIEIKQNEVEQLQVALNETIKRAKDELDMHEQTRKVRFLSRRSNFSLIL